MFVGTCSIARATCWKQPIGKESPDKAHNIYDVTSKNILILVQYLTHNLGHVPTSNVPFMQLVFKRLTALFVRYFTTRL
jgi:hypothetical protein